MRRAAPQRRNYPSALGYQRVCIARSVAAALALRRTLMGVRTWKMRVQRRHRTRAVRDAAAARKTPRLPVSYLPTSAPPYTALDSISSLTLARALFAPFTEAPALGIGGNWSSRRGCQKSASSGYK